MADNERIITTIAVLGNPTIQGKTKNIVTFPGADVLADTDRYWKDIDIPERRRKLFPVEYWQLDKLMKKTGQIALLVKNINDVNKMEATWKSYSNEKPPVLKEHDRCFVIPLKYYKGILEILEIGKTSHSIRGLSSVKQHGINSNFLVSLIGKKPTGEYVLYLNNAYATLMETDPGQNFDTSPGGEGASGLKLPV